MADLLAPENTAFAVALALLGLLLLVQIVGLGHIFPDVDFDSDGPDIDVGSSLASLIGLGRLPMVVWLSCLLAAFGLIGLAVQDFATAMLGAPLPALAAIGGTLIVALPVNAGLTRILSAIWPHDETTALPIEALLGKRGTISIGTASRGNPARALVQDRFGQPHNVMVEPHEDDGILAEGAEILLVRREGELFFALGGSDPLRIGS